MPDFTPSRFQYLGHEVTNPSPYLLLCKTRGIGIILMPLLLRPHAAHQVRWLTLANVVSMSGTSPDEIKRRIRDGWTGYELTKPDGYQRVVDARKHGITWNGRTDSIKGWAASLGLTVVGFTYRLANPNYPMEVVMSPGRRVERITTSRCPQGVTDDPVISKSGSVGGVFFYGGAVDTLAGHAKAAGLNLSTVQYRLRRRAPDGTKMTIAQALTTAKGCVVRTDRGVPNKRKGFRDPFAKGPVPNLAAPRPTEPEAAL